MIRGTNHSRSKRITPKFATAKAMVYIALMDVDHPVVYTGTLIDTIYRLFKETTFCPTYDMTLEALSELREQGFISRAGSNDCGYYWWSRDRLV